MKERLSKLDRLSTSDQVKRGVLWAWFVFIVQIPFVVWYAQGASILL